MQNLESVAQKMAELHLDAPETPPLSTLLTPLTRKNLILCRDSPYELPCKIWSMYLKKWPSYCTRYERGHLLLRTITITISILSGLYSPNFLVRSSQTLDNNKLSGWPCSSVDGRLFQEGREQVHLHQHPGGNQSWHSHNFSGGIRLEPFEHLALWSAPEEKLEHLWPIVEVVPEISTSKGCKLWFPLHY